MVREYTYHRVSCDHKAERFRLDQVIVKVRKDPFEGKYYWSHSPYGCSKMYLTAREAIYGMLGDHACHAIHIHDLTVEEEIEYILSHKDHDAIHQMCSEIIDIMLENKEFDFLAKFVLGRLDGDALERVNML